MRIILQIWDSEPGVVKKRAVNMAFAFSSGLCRVMELA